MRVLGAWCYAFTQKADHGIVCLMVKHMLEGQGFPVFYYGQAYLGTLEPAVSVALCSVFGLSGFWINMGTALVAFAFLPLVYLWGRDAAGRTGGLAALAFCIVGPPVYFQYEGWAYGGYAGIPLLTCAVLAVTARMLVRERSGGRNGHAHFLLLGVVAGLGWWQSPLLIPAFLVSAFLFLAVLRLRLFTLRLLSGAAGFFLGSAPLWLWNADNRWKTLNMLSTEGRPSFVEGLRLFYRVRLPEFLDLARLPSAARTIFAALLLLLVALAVALLIGQLRARLRDRAIPLGAALAYLLLLSVLFTLSHYAKVPALRYELALIPVLGVVAGAGTAWLAARARWGLGWLPLLAWIALQASALPVHFLERVHAKAFEGQARELAALLRTRGVRHVYTEYQRYRASHGLNFLLGEEFVFSDHAAEKYRPYAWALELAEHPAVLNDLNHFDSFLNLTRGTAASYESQGLATPYDRIYLRYAAEPPPATARPMPAGEEVAIVAGGANITAMLTDGSLVTRWRSPSGKGVRSELEIRFKRPRRLVGVRLSMPETGCPASLAAEGWDDAQRRWMVLQPDRNSTFYFWSGPRFYLGGGTVRLECRFEPMETARLKVRVGNSPKRSVCEIAELQVFEEAAPAPLPGGPELDRLAALLRERGLEKVYADRWEANMLYARTRGGVRLSLAPGVLEAEALPPAMTLDGKSALVVGEREAELTRRVLAERRIPARETAAGPWIVFDFPDAAAALSRMRDPGLRWVGFGCLTERDAAR